MRRLALALCLLSAFGCAEAAPVLLPGAGEACDDNGECAAGLDCRHLVCVDNEGPSLSWVLPFHLEAYEGEIDSLAVNVHVSSSSAGDQVELIVDPGADDPHREVFVAADLYTTINFLLPTPLAVGPHHLRARLLDDDGQPYANPSASAEIVVFVRDLAIPDTPQIAIVWPPSGYEHRLGNPLEVEIAVLPGSFAFVTQGDSCEPLPNCEPELAPECESECGPVSRYGHARLYSQLDFPECLLGEGLDCNTNYIANLRPGGDVDVIDAHQVRGVLDDQIFEAPGAVPLAVALSYDNYGPYPSAANVIHETVELQLVE
jgi:hypothetical protein